MTATGLGLPSYSLSYAQDEYGVPFTNRIGNAGYDYDQSGNLTIDGELTYTYDAAGRLTTASMLDSSYGYDGDGRRVKQGNSTGTMYYLWSSLLGEPVVELDDLGGVYRAYVYGPGGQLLAMQANDFQFYWMHQDHLGSTRRLTDGSGAEVYRAEYDPHGQMLEEWALDGQLYKNSHKFTGYERDWTTGLDNAKARMYANKVGRFMQPDPLGVAAADATNPQSLNRYSYVRNDPVNFIDPDGLMLALACWWEDYYGWNDRGESVTGSTQVCAIIDIGGGYGGGPIGPIDPPGGGGGGGGQQGGGQNVRVQPSCRDFVDSLVGLVRNAYNKKNALINRPGIGGGLDSVISSSEAISNALGSSMVGRAVHNIDVNGREYLKGNPPLPQGFRRDLIDNGQSGDVYHHIEFIAGNYFLGVAGQIAIKAFIEVDRRQARSGRLESVTELRDDEAGKQVGEAMLNAFNSGRFDKLRDTLRGILCVP